MTDKEIIEKIIRKADENGYLSYNKKNFYLLDVNYPIITIINDYGIGPCIKEKIHINEIIFNVEFAKAFFGKSVECNHYNQRHDCTGCNLNFKNCSHKQEQWITCQNELLNEIQQGKNPLKYFEKHLKDQQIADLIQPPNLKNYGKPFILELYKLLKEIDTYNDRLFNKGNK